MPDISIARATMRQLSKNLDEAGVCGRTAAADCVGGERRIETRARGDRLMPLQDHFHPPLSVRRHWTSFHSCWATCLAADLNRRLPPRYFAEANAQFGIEIDVATFEEAETIAAEKTTLEASAGAEAI